MPPSFWRDEWIQAALADRHMGRVIRTYRQHQYHGRRPLAQEIVAGWLGVTQAQLSRIENGPAIAHLERLIHCAEVLGIPERYLWFALPGSRLGSTVHAGPAGRFSCSAEDDVLEELDDVAQATERIRWLRATNVDEETIGQLDGLIERYAKEYEETGGNGLYRRVLQQRGALDDLLRGHHSAAQRADLLVLAAKLSVILAHLAFDLGRDSLAQTYCVEAWTVAELAGHRGLLADVRATQSFVAYYRHQYRDALLLALDGARHAGNRPAAVRVAVQEARAQARLGERSGVDRAIERAFDLRQGLDEPDRPRPFLSFAPYDTSRIAGNAATAYLSLGQADNVRRYAGMALPLLEAHGARAGQALTKLDAASSLLLERSAEPDQAAVIASEAIQAGGGLPSAVIARRTTEFLQTARRWSRVPEVAEISDAIGEWQRALPQPSADTKGSP